MKTLIIPAIDIQGGTVVRLRQGKFTDVTRYDDNPLKVAQHWVNLGAECLHIVDLDGAKSRQMINYPVIKDLAEHISVPVQVGGGIRTQRDIALLLHAGVKLVILGTKAVEDKNFLKEVLKLWPDNIAVSVDCMDGMVSVRGWTEVSSLPAVPFCKELEDLGLKYLVYTDIQRDGMLSGPNLEGLKQILDSVKINVIASGGVSKIADIKNLLALKAENLFGIISGKALYEQTLDITEAVKLCSQNG